MYLIYIDVLYNPVLHHAKLHLPALRYVLYINMRKPLKY